MGGLDGRAGRAGRMGWRRRRGRATRFPCDGFPFLILAGRTRPLARTDSFRIEESRYKMGVPTASGRSLPQHERGFMSTKQVLAGFLLFAGWAISIPARAQVAPTVKVSGLPLGVGGGLSDYSVDYGPGRRMLGFSEWADYELFHGIGIEAEGTEIILDKPSSLQRMKQETIKGGVIYKAREFWKIRPYAKGLIGIGNIDFPSNDPFYTHDTFVVEAFGGGVEYPVWNSLKIRGDYEYQMWNQYFGNNNLTPNGFTIGATYYFRKIHKHL